ncbi:GDCCVxC domain-containing (seleno)protein [Paraburkholderia terrae]|nr:GDCCVxC domain-containing (seleno)protein [Paraburkholderia terrae]MDW3657366.1 GDCCVxC domain-containing (seleno)protein [Paraburkholderia terrae]
MPNAACVWHFECGHCKTLLRPKLWDCCVY